MKNPINLSLTLLFLFLSIPLIMSCQPEEEEVAADVSSPSVISTYPANNAISISLNTTIFVTFSEAMDASSVTTNTLNTNCSGAIQVSNDDFTSCIQMLYSPSFDSQKMVFTLTPKSDLSESTVYKIKVTDVAKDTAGNMLKNEYLTSYGFTTGSEADSTAPTVMSIIPDDSSTDVALNPSISVTFSEAINVSTVTTNTISATCSGSFLVSTDNFSTCVKMSTDPSADSEKKTFTISPTLNLENNTTYKIKVTTAVKDISANALASDYITSTGFKTLMDTIAPTVSSVTPADGATGTTVNTAITAVFSEVMASSTITTTTFTLKEGATPISGAVAYSGTTATFTPASSLNGSKEHTATITTGVKDSAGNALTFSYSWTFITGTESAGIWDSATWDSNMWGN